MDPLRQTLACIPWRKTFRRGKGKRFRQRIIIGIVAIIAIAAAAIILAAVRRFAAPNTALSIGPGTIPRIASTENVVALVRKTSRVIIPKQTSFFAAVAVPIAVKRAPGFTLVMPTLGIESALIRPATAGAAVLTIPAVAITVGASLTGRTAVTIIRSITGAKTAVRIALPTTITTIGIGAGAAGKQTPRVTAIATVITNIVVETATISYSYQTRIRTISITGVVRAITPSTAFLARSPKAIALAGFYSRAAIRSGAKGCTSGGIAFFGSLYRPVAAGPGRAIFLLGCRRTGVTAGTIGSIESFKPTGISTRTGITLTLIRLAVTTITNLPRPTPRRAGPSTAIWPALTISTRTFIRAGAVRPGKILLYTIRSATNIATALIITALSNYIITGSPATISPSSPGAIVLAGS